MDTHILPEGLLHERSDAIQLFNYQTLSNIQKSRVNLSKNTISFLRMGKKEVVGEDQAVIIDNSQFLIMKSGNCLMTEKVSAVDKVYKSTLLFFSDEHVLDVIERNKFDSKLSAAHKSFYIFKYSRFLEHFVKSLEELTQLPASVQEKILLAKFEELMLYLVHQHGPSFLHSLAQRKGNTIQRMTNVVDSNKLQRLSLQELAFLCNMSISTFKRTFAKHYHTTPSKWFSDQRLEHASLLLKNHQMRPVELYEAAGYRDLSNFIQAFKKKYGITPKQYQSQN